MTPAEDFGTEQLSREEVLDARRWWRELDSEYKARASIWTVLALYARARNAPPPQSSPVPERRV